MFQLLISRREMLSLILVDYYFEIRQLADGIEQSKVYYKQVMPIIKLSRNCDNQGGGVQA
jgi:hypothetical protein